MTQEKEFSGKVALVTGGGEGIGASTAKLLASCGAKVGVLGRTESNISKVAEAIRKDGGEAIHLTADISEPGEVKSAIDKLVEKYGGLDYTFAHAGINGVWAPIEELAPDEWSKTIHINLSGTFYTIKYAVPHMKKRGGGSVVITSSVNGNRIFSNTGATAYSSSKAGQVAMGKMLALELAPSKIRVNVMCPGAIDTEIDDNTKERDTNKAEIPVEFPEGSIPLTGGTPGKPEDCAELVRYLFSKRSGHITGSVIYVDGAESLIEG